MANNGLSDKFDTLSDEAKESANKLRAAGEREKDQLKADTATTRGREPATAENIKANWTTRRVGRPLNSDEFAGNGRPTSQKVRSNIEAKRNKRRDRRRPPRWTPTSLKTTPGPRSNSHRAQSRRRRPRPLTPSTLG